MKGRDWGLEVLATSQAKPGPFRNATGKIAKARGKGSSPGSPESQAQRVQRLRFQLWQGTNAGGGGAERELGNPK